MATGGSLKTGEQFCKRVISRIRSEFVEHLDPVALVDTCLTEEYFTNIQARDIKETVLTSDKNRLILELVSKKGVKGYNDFKMCLEKSSQDNLVEYITDVESKIGQLDPVDEESELNKDQGYHCFSCKYSCGNLKLLEQHLTTTEHLDMVNEQIKFSEKNTEPNEDEESDVSTLDNSSFQHSYSEVQKCYICNIVFTSESHAESHFKGKPHQRKEVKFETMRRLKESSFKTDSFRSLQLSTTSVAGQSDSLRAPLSKETYPAFSHLAESEPNSGLTCDICKVSFTGPENAKQHFESDKHNKKAFLMKQKQEGEGLPLKCDVCNCSFSGQENARDHFKSEKHKKKVRKSEVAYNNTSVDGRRNEQVSNDTSVDRSINELVSNDTSVDGSLNEQVSNDTSIDGSINELVSYDTTVDGSRNEQVTNGTSVDGSSVQSTESSKSINALNCDICKVKFTGPESAEQHYSSDKHQKKERLMKREQQGDLLPLSCDICKCNFTGQENAEAHFNGAKHKKKKRDSEIGGYPLSCSTSLRSFQGQRNSRDHFEGARLSQKEENMQTGKGRNDERNNSVSEGDVQGSNSESNGSAQKSPTEDEMEETVENRLARLKLNI